MEAQAAGLPIVASDTGGIPEAVIPDETAFLVPPKAVHSFADKLHLLLHDTERWRKMSKAGQEFVKKTFDGPILNKKLEEMLQDLLK